LRDWRGAATLLPPRLTYELRPRYGPTVNWCGIRVPRLWRCGNRGSASSVLIEKPARGDFLPVLDGGYSLQYSPLMEYCEGRGMILFCQLDVTGRTEPDPAAEILAKNVIHYASAWKPTERHQGVYVGDTDGKKHLASLGVALVPFESGKLSSDHVLIVGPGGGQTLASDSSSVAKWLAAGGHLLAIGVGDQDAKGLPLKVSLRRAEHISAFFQPPSRDSLFQGTSPADVHNRDPRELFLITGGATPLGDGVLAQVDGTNVVFCQLAPWQFGPSQQPNLRKTYRRTSFLVSRLLANMGVAGSTPIVARFGAPVAADEKRWQEGLYLDQPEEWDDPYRFFRW
jgi:beta-galactosidase